MKKEIRNRIILYAAVLATVLAGLCLGSLLFVQTRFILVGFFNRTQDLPVKIENYIAFIDKNPAYIPPRLKLAKYYTQMAAGEIKRHSRDILIDRDYIRRNAASMKYISLALEQYKQILGLKPDNIEAMKKLVDIHIALKEFDKARELYEKIVKADPKNGIYHLRLAYAYFAEQKTDLALAEVNKALAIDPENAQAHLFSALVYAKIGETAKVIGAYKKAAEKFRDDNELAMEAEARYRLGFLFINKKLFFDAAEQFERITQIRPNLLVPYVQLGATYYFMGLNNKAISTLTEPPMNPEEWDTSSYYDALIPKPDRVRAYSILANAYLKKKDFSKALKYFKKTKTLGMEYNRGFLERIEQLAKTPWEDIEKRYKVGERVKGTVVDVTKYGVAVELQSGIEGIIDPSDIAWSEKLINPDEFVKKGEEVEAVVLGIDEEEREISLGMKQLKENPWLGVQERFREGDTVKGTVTDVKAYGIVVNLDKGVDGIVDASDISWTAKFRHPAEIIKKGQEIEAKVLRVDEDGKSISLGIKQLTKDPWKEVNSFYKVGDRVTGKVVDVTAYGVLVGLKGGINGFIDSSDISWTEKYVIPSEKFAAGDDVEAVVMGISEQSREVDLSIKQLTRDPWETLSQKYQPGSTWQAKVTYVTDYAAYVEIEKGIEGVLYSSDVGMEETDRLRDIYKADDIINVKVVSVDYAGKKINLTQKGLMALKVDKPQKTEGIGEKNDKELMRTEDE